MTKYAPLLTEKYFNMNEVKASKSAGLLVLTVQYGSIGVECSSWLKILF
jgi:hypothetical protein